MSLVAYESSGESSEDDENETTATLPVAQSNSHDTPTAPVAVAHPPTTDSVKPVLSMDDNDDVETKLKLPAPRTMPVVAMITKDLVSDKEPTTNLFTDLPSSSAIRSSRSDEVEDDLEDIVKPGRAELELRAQVAKKSTAGGTGKRSRVQILVPALLPVGGDSDEDDAPLTTAKKPLKASAHKSALLSSLPPPAHATTITALVPQSLLSKSRQTTAPLSTKPLATPPVKATVGTKTTPANDQSSTLSRTAGPGMRTRVVEADSDEEEGEGGGVNFFSLDAGDSSKSFLPCVSLAAPHVALASADGTDNVDSWSGTMAQTVQRPTADVPLCFKPTSTWTPTSSRSNAVDAAASWNASGNDSVYGYDEMVPQVPVADAWMETQANWSAGDDTDLQSTSEVPASSGAAFPGNVNDPQFQRMFGKKSATASGAKKPDIKVIDVRLDDVLTGVDLTKNLTKEVDNMMSHSKKHNKDLPSGQQKRKHQITYLAYKAKERELELKNQWAENKFNKRQTQSKYGF